MLRSEIQTRLPLVNMPQEAMLAVVVGVVAEGAEMVGVRRGSGRTILREECGR